MNCRNPVDSAVIADYWLGKLPQVEEEAIEEHFFECDACSHRLRESIALVDGIRTLAIDGSLMMVVNDTLLERFAEEGLTIREYAPPPGGAIACTVTEDDDILIGRLSADLRGAEQIDLRFFDERGVERHRLRDIPFQEETGNVVFQQSITYAKAAPSETMIARLVALDGAGAERLLGEYTFQHTRTISGPAGW